MRPARRSHAVLAGMAGLLAALLPGCGGPPVGAPGDRVDAEGQAMSALLRPAPGDFIALPCLGTPAGTPCAIIRAGGKTLLFGAPEGVTGALDAAGSAQPDGVFLFSLTGAGTEGLLRLRNQTWIAGRRVALPVAGPEGTPLLLGHLDKAMERADALAYLHHRPRGRLGAALFAPVAIDPRIRSRVFDSGDLAVSAHPANDGTVHYAVRYGDATLLLLACPAPEEALADPAASLVIACRPDGSGRDDWPLAAPGLAIATDVQAAVQP